TFGLKRAEILSAQANGFTLLVLAGLVVYGGISRLVHPGDPGGWAMLGVALNLVATRQLAGANRESLNVEGAYQHVVTDLAAFALTAAAAVVILTLGFERADGIAALAIAAIMLRASFGLLRDSGRVLLEAAPGGMSVEAIGHALVEHPHV